jgi:hypothetical protein
VNRSVLIFALASCLINAFAQVEETSREWNSFVQTADVSFLKRKVKFKVQASVKVLTDDSTSWAGLFTRIDNKHDENGFFDNMYDRPVRSSVWQTYSIEGFLDENSDKLNFGGLALGNGKFYFDNFEFFFENERGEMQKADIKNFSFETLTVKNSIPNWVEGTKELKPVRIKEFTFQSSQDRVHGKYSLLMEGRNIKKDTTALLNPSKEFSPQIATLVAMLNNLSQRVEEAVSYLNQQELDHHLDEKANSIGALIMHLAAAEAYYQVYTFENRVFNDEEKKQWGVALDLGEEGKTIQGHDAKYYLDIYKQVRKRTIELLASKNDEWLTVVHPADNMNNHFAWFHVMEHQSSHLGQILFLKKRLPERPKTQTFEMKLEH